MTRSPRLRAAGVHLLSVLAASCSAPSPALARAPAHGADVERPHLDCALVAQAPVPTSAPSSTVSLEHVHEDDAGARHFAFSDGSELVLDPLEPFASVSVPVEPQRLERAPALEADSAASLFLVATLAVALVLLLFLARRSAPTS